MSDVQSALARHPEQSGLIMDFDGVLSLIVDDPGSSRAYDGVLESLIQISQKLGLTAIISGRPLRFLQDRLPQANLTMLGSYGLEELQQGETIVNPAAVEWLDAVSAASDELYRELAGVEGVRVEGKSVSVAVHWRQAKDRAAAQDKVVGAVARIVDATGLRREPGKLVEELRPPIDVDKGTAVRGLLQRTGITVPAYAGDDLGDVPALKVVRSLGGYGLVVDHGVETDPQLRELASQKFDGVSNFASWLTELNIALGS